MERQNLIKSIISSLTWLSTQVSVNNKLNLTDINVHSENFYRDLLNLAFDYKFENINIVESNAAAIDLGDEVNKIAIQVTSTSTLAKTKHTVTKFIEKKLYKKYTSLVILNIAAKTKHSVPTVGDENHYLNTKDDIWDIGDLVKRINNKELSDLKKINNFLNEQLFVQSSDSIPRNVETILRLIELISDEEHPAVGSGYIDEPFPDEKINKRFADHANFLKEEYYNLHKEYGAVLNAVEQESDISQIKIRRVSQHLRVYSDQVLTDCNGDPKMALNEIVKYFTNLLAVSGFEADTGAAMFYIVKHLIKCNVFPNKEAIND